MNPQMQDISETLLPAPLPIIRKRRWNLWLIWAIPIFAAALAGYYGYQQLHERGQRIDVKFDDATGLQSGQTPIEHRGVNIGTVESIQLSSDNAQAVVKVELNRRAEAFAKQGAVFWIVRPQISLASVSGLSTVLSGPYIEAMPGTGEPAKQFTGLSQAPAAMGPGLHILLRTDHAGHLEAGAPIYFRDLQVGVIESVALGTDSRRVDIGAFIQKRYTSLVRANSEFWMVSGADLKGGLFSGVELKLDSLRSLLSGGVAFATPANPRGEPTAGPAIDQAEFSLHDEAKKDWLNWAPNIPLVHE